MRILSFSGSIRTGSSNTALLLAAKSLAPKPVEIEIYSGLSELPYFNPDLDCETLPPSVQRLRQVLARSNALLISTPEYAHGIPGLLKNALDWLVSDTNFAGKPVGLLYASATEASFSQDSLIEILTTMSARAIREAIISVPGARAKITPQGKISDVRTETDLLRAIEALIAVTAGR